MEHFTSGWKRNYYGKGDVIVYRLNRDGRVPAGANAVFGAKVLMLLYGDAFWPTYTTGDNTGLIATDSMKNFIQRETLNFEGFDLEEYCEFLGTKFLAKYPQAEGVQVSASELPYESLPHRTAFTPAGPERVTARVEITRQGVVEAVSGVHGFRLMRLGGSAFTGFVRDEYTTLPELHDRPLHMWLDVDLHYRQPTGAFNQGACVATARATVSDVFTTFKSGSIQEVIYQMGTRMLAELPSLAEVHLEAQNRTWDAVAEGGPKLGVWTDPRPPYGCLGLRLRR
jgi:urate oxidase / 2-oxo-4-hydroxy-4-carboxy-5-ureidoimidazoline decarboxylase